MKIVYCIGSLSPKGGTEKVLANKTKYFVEKFGYDIHILINDQKNEPFAYDYSEKIVFHDMKISTYLKKPIIPVISYKLLQKKLIPIYLKKITEINPDVIIVLQHGIEDFIIPRLKINIPKLREFHFAKKAVEVCGELITNYWDRTRYSISKKNIFKKINQYDYMVLLTENDKHYGQYKPKTIVIPNMLDNDAFNNPKSNLQNKRVISVGSMHDTRKGFDIQILLWKEIIKIHPNWKLDIYGDGAIKNELQLLIDENGLREVVTLHGNTSVIYEKYSESSIFLFTSRAEGFGMVLIEAMSSGLPCISLDCPEGPGDIIQNGINGFLIKNDDSKELFEKLIFLISDEKKRLEMGLNAIKRSKYYSVENISKKWVDLFDTIKKDSE